MYGIAILGHVPKLHKICKWYVEVNERNNDLKTRVEELESKVNDMDKKAMEEDKKPGKKRKRVTDAYIKEVKRYKESVGRVLERSQEGSWKLKLMMLVPCIERHFKEAERLLTKGKDLLKAGLTYNEVRTRGEKLPLGDQYMGETTRGLMLSALQAIKSGAAKIIGIYGSGGAGKTNIMKYIYNEIYEDKDGTKAVFWATAPEVEQQNHGNYKEALQKRVADEMWISDLDNKYYNEATRAGRIMARLQEIGRGRKVLFLDNVREEFSAVDLLGLPSLDSNSDSNTTTESELDAVGTVNCILVFTALSKDICNRMQCDRTLKMDQLGDIEAQNLFLHEIRHIREDQDPLRVPSNQELKIQDIAIEVANQCARMPQPIIFIAQSMARIRDPREWRNRLNELNGTIASIHENEEAKILDQLEYGYLYLEDTIVQHCFLNAAKLLANDPAKFLANDPQVSKVKIICNWKKKGLIGMDRQGNYGDDQGHVILNQFERFCFIQVAPDNETVTMNKWIWKMANRVGDYESRKSIHLKGMNLGM